MVEFLIMTDSSVLKVQYLTAYYPVSAAQTHHLGTLISGGDFKSTDRQSPSSALASGTCSDRQSGTLSQSTNQTVTLPPSMNINRRRSSWLT
ncbi:hypothetical protein POX_b02458 [Penicillium oxalicum]|uniref:hypothetical protein n=1 Tax=Penicillium oxalicum TaxID=69781 RepID=UPI0020B773C6|nr:hypothetical protein POX_b02458 [Penicillium oxalicum]KAI2792420.1 hypothetical protein POX_b02458 [Penicillium oxalicum]